MCAYGSICWGGGGDSPRNTPASPPNILTVKVVSGTAACTPVCFVLCHVTLHSISIIMTSKLSQNAPKPLSEGSKFKNCELRSHGFMLPIYLLHVYSTSQKFLSLYDASQHDLVSGRGHGSCLSFMTAKPVSYETSS